MDSIQAVVSAEALEEAVDSVLDEQEVLVSDEQETQVPDEQETPVSDELETLVSSEQETLVSDEQEAEVARELGYTVSGSDQNVYPPMSTQLEQQGIQLMNGYKAKNLDCKGFNSWYGSCIKTEIR